MKLPYLNRIPAVRQGVDVFLGYNHKLRIGDGELYDMENMTSDYYPILAPRGPRGAYAQCTSFGGMVSKDDLCYADGSELVVGTERIEMGLLPGEKRLVSMGAYIIILPDKKYINTADTNERGDIESEYTSVGEVRLSLWHEDGQDAITVIGSDTAPNGTDYWYFIDTSKTPYTLNSYSSVTGAWSEFNNAAVRIDAEGIGATFEIGDSVMLNGFSDTLICTDIINVSGTPLLELSEDERCMTVLAKDDDFILVTGLVAPVVTMLGNAWNNLREIIEQENGDSYTMPRELIQNIPLSVYRRMPDMDFVIESNNRLWGCRYGVSADGEVVNEIYASALGSFKNWNSFRGIASDSFAASVGSDGAFTGAAVYGGYPIFFKENVMHKIYGDYPSSFQISTVPCRGVEKGSHGSLAIVNEVLYYKAQHAVCAYDGSLPVSVSDALGGIEYKNAVSGAFGGKYYISMCDMSGMWHLFVYDTHRGLWHREDNTHVLSFASHGGRLYFADAADMKIKTDMGKDERRVKWFCESGLMGTSTPDKKHITRLMVRLSPELGTVVRFYIEYDSSGAWQHAATAMGEKLGSFAVPIKPRRCDHMRLRIEGEGDAKIFSITKQISEGSDVG